MDFTFFFEKYEALAAKGDEAVQRVYDMHPDLVLCKPGCTDCCYALFDLTLVEALYLNHKFKETFTGQALENMLEKANTADRQIYKLKREAFKAAQEGQEETAVVEEMAKKRIRCPMLSDEDLCSLYPHRPLACRIYGVPLAIGGSGRTCGLSGFVKGSKYPTVNMDIIQDQLIALSTELVKRINSRRVGLPDVLVPVSMAMLTEYNEEYLGMPVDEEKDKS